ncbi:uncharacterized protein LOC131525932 [Onychostoma macrolepis]|uniref:uncharacterized protein LOC131525932 n=1 Tax=Onychostoma macrolepis TaxID=369639 RepID=UPI00272CD659|nr:uncharacterized protein LOC131525932 [Onychostoma macrolepis]XP_058609923.1 uncharacterized protein LOC131525932 [Onychostoma macrolepis]
MNHFCFMLNKSTSLLEIDPALFLPFHEPYHSGAETREGSRNAATSMSSPSGSPFADVIHSLAGLHQEQHQALLDMREDQERRFRALVQTQQEDRELFRNWMDREVRAGGSPPAPALPAHMPLSKMGPQDDPEAFIDLFERTAEACGCQPSHRSRGAGAVRGSAAEENRAVGPVPSPDVARPGHSTGGGPDGGVPRGRRNPAFCLSLSLSLLLPPPNLSLSLGLG